MPMSKLLAVREFEIIICNPEYKSSSEYRYLDEVHFRELEHFIKGYVSSDDGADAYDFMKIGSKRYIGDTISLTNYVGIIELPSGFQIEVLPKISFDAQDLDYKKTKRVFLDMLCCLKEFEGKSFSNAALNADRMNLYEVFINMFLWETRNLVKKGIKSSYINISDNLKYYKGKLNVGMHIKENLVHKERFFMNYDEYQINCPENRLVKSTLFKLKKVSRSSENQKEIRQLLGAFEFVEESSNYVKDFSKVTIDRNNKNYEILLQWAKIFLFNKSFTTFSGDKLGKAILFPMEKVFEGFVTNWVKKIFEEESKYNLTVSSQHRGFYLFDDPRKFRLRPDIVVEGYKDGKKKLIILDTKWKRLNRDPSINYGIAQADMYQMYAYAKKYHTQEIWLLYPWYEDIKDIGDIYYNAVEDESLEVNIRVFFVDVANYRESIIELFEKI